MALNFTSYNGTDGSNQSTAGPIYGGPSTGEVVAYSSMYGLISLVALVGNILVCLVITKNPSMRTATNVFLLNLAIADIIFIIVSVPAILALQIFEEWPFGEAACKGVPFLNIVTLSASVYTMVALAIDRYNAIVHPLRAKVTHTMRRAVIVISLIWLLSAVVALPQIMVWTLEDFCVERWSIISDNHLTSKDVYTVAIFVIFFAVPMAIITVAYITIIKRLTITDGILTETAQISHDPSQKESHSIDEKSVPISRNNRKTTFMMLTVIVAFLVCMLPLNVFLLVTPFLTSFNEDSMYMASTVLQFLSVCSAACNPIIYNFFSVKFRRAFADVFRSRCGTKQPVHKSRFYSSFRTKGTTLL
ncbi:orexin receptor type 2 [Exaiptasia diaphana]|uniref:G-protein coupled receptors family 1 profile domain-containing protein n=1 Tax=Exaiptasia diaphana TaxID=2652724 RepID=A0A913XVL4_EXADI|nr:orexin receptor type 2 [Exaiptasia diaphana]XP_028517527.1 orexin receptor type 2 [Exaiptasia diaphana]KXJ24675.1 Orexin receptor type 2 [Exaiptasia diaphana]